MVLNKADLKMGIKATKLIKIPSMGNQEVEIRKLSNNEVAEIQEIESQGLGTMESQQGVRGRQNNTIKINPSKQIKSSNKAKIIAVAYSLSIGDEIWTAQEVDHDLDGVLVQEIYDEVVEYNNIRPETVDEIEEFPED